MSAKRALPLFDIALWGVPRGDAGSDRPVGTKRLRLCVPATIALVRVQSRGPALSVRSSRKSLRFRFSLRIDSLRRVRKVSPSYVVLTANGEPVRKAFAYRAYEFADAPGALIPPSSSGLKAYVVKAMTSFPTKGKKGEQRAAAAAGFSMAKPVKKVVRNHKESPKGKVWHASAANNAALLLSCLDDGGSTEEKDMVSRGFFVAEGVKFNLSLFGAAGRRDTCRRRLSDGSPQHRANPSRVRG